VRSPRLAAPVARVLLHALQLSRVLPGGNHGSVLLATAVTALVALVEVRPHPTLPETRFAATLRTDNSPPPKEEAQPTSHALTSDSFNIWTPRLMVWSGSGV
jgi:hypothetical protein